MTGKKEQSLKELVKEAIIVMTSVRDALKGLLIEEKSSNRRHMDASDFSINEFKRLTESIDKLAAQFEKLK